MFIFLSPSIVPGQTVRSAAAELPSISQQRRLRPRYVRVLFVDVLRLPGELPAFLLSSELKKLASTPSEVTPAPGFAGSSWGHRGHSESYFG